MPLRDVTSTIRDASSAIRRPHVFIFVRSPNQQGRIVPHSDAWLEADLSRDGIVPRRSHYLIDFADVTRSTLLVSISKFSVSKIEVLN
jgi:hypothetical protein